MFISLTLLQNVISFLLQAFNNFLFVQERERLSHKLERMRLKRRRMATEKGNGTKVVEDLDDQVQ